MGKIFYIMGKSAAGKDRIYSLLAGNKELNLKKLVLYTTRPIRAGEQDGVQYYFTDDSRLEEFKKLGKLIEARAYHTVHGIWTYFTADDGQVDLSEGNYLGIGTLESYQKLKQYYGEEHVIPVYIEVEDGERSADGHFFGSGSRKNRNMKRCADVFWQIRRTFRRKTSGRQELNEDLLMRI